MSAKVIPICRHRPVEGLSPTLFPAADIAPPTYLVCGKCGYRGVAEFYIHSAGEDPFEAVCNCPLVAVLLA